MQYLVPDCVLQGWQRCHHSIMERATRNKYKGPIHRRLSEFLRELRYRPDKQLKFGRVPHLQTPAHLHYQKRKAEQRERIKVFSCWCRLKGERILYQEQGRKK